MTFRARTAFPRLLALAFAAVVLSLAAHGSASAQPGPRVYLMRGLANVFSTGLDTLASKLQAKGISANVYEYGQWQQLADDAVAWSRANGKAPVVIIGHSLGADTAIEMAERMTALGIPPRLVVTFDPVGVTQVGRSGGRFVNYYQSNNGFGKRLTTGPGFSGTLVNRNEDAAAAQGLDHFNIEKAEALHQDVIAMVRALARPKPRPKPAPAADPAAPTAGAATPAPAASAQAPAETVSAASH
ncbi:thioesterase domain-containing protein [Azorhizobium doebereinerae]|uniref:thioesterase domain-containing protein n=1 Tax=Azorhizobium doebereinerae TaxID=281091 RepID=UPI00041E9325|nr:thioesterase domain-containing protein [Azorhizobium doebereinerae]